MSKVLDFMKSEAVFHGHGFPEPIGLEYIASMLTHHEFICSFRNPNELSIFDGHTKPISFLSAISSEYPTAVAAAKEAKARGEITVLGGYHACGCQDDIANGPFDYIVVGEGEKVALAIAKAHLAGESKELNRFDSRNIGRTRVVKADRINDLDKLPMPLRSGDRLANYRIYDLMWPPASKQRNTALVLASRGCANDCDFCASSSVWGRGIRLRSPEQGVDELLDLNMRFGTNTVVFIDQSLGQARQWTLDLCTAIKNGSPGINWYHQSNLSVDRDVIRAMAEAGCTKIGFGVEGISPQAIARIKPVNPLDLESINSLCDYCNSLGIFVKAYLMIGFPWETENTILEYLNWIQELRVNQVKLSYFTPFPGTRAWAQYSSQLISYNWADFDTVSLPVVYNPSISAGQYHKIRNKLFKTFYGSSTYAAVTRQMLYSFPHYKISYQEFADYLWHFDMISGYELWIDWVRPSQTRKKYLAGAGL